MPKHKSTTELPDPAGYSDLRARIVARYPELSRQLKEIAEFALSHPETMAMETSAQLAERLSVQPSSLVRFAQALGYRGFNEMKRSFRSHLIFKIADARDQAAGNGEMPGDSSSILRSLIEQATSELSAMVLGYDEAQFERAVTALANAQRIVVTAQHLAYPFASLFAWKLLRSGVPCQLLDNVGGYALRQSELATEDQALLAIGFAPYQPSVVQAARAHSERGGAVVAISDTPLSPLAPFAGILLEVPFREPAAPRPLAAATCLVQALAMAVVRAREAR